MDRLLYSFVIVVFYLTGITGCSSAGIKERLSLADNLMMERPDSSLSIVESIDTSKIRGTRLQALYSLLHTMAIDRTGKDTTDYALISNAVDYYEYHGGALYKARTAFYEGRIHYNCKDYSSACVCFLKALSLAESTDDNWLVGMICYFLSESYNRNRIKAEELKYSRLALEHFSSFGDVRYVDNARYKLAIANHNNGLYYEADSLFEQIPPGCLSYKYALLGRAENEIVKDNPDAEAAVALFENAYREGAPFTPLDLYQYAYALILDNKPDAADRLISRLENNAPDVQSVWWKYAIERKRGNDIKALSYYEEYANLQSSYISSLLAQSLFKAEKSFYLTQKEKAESRTAILSLSLLVSILTLSLVILIIIAITANKRNRIERERDVLAQRINEIQSLLETIKSEKKGEDYSQEQSSLQTVYVTLFREHFSEIGKLIGTNLEYSLKMDEIQRKYLKYINHILAEISSDEGKNKHFEARVNRAFDNVIQKIRSDFPEMSDDSIRMLCFVIAGFKDPTIATIMNRSLTAISTRKSRLKKQIVESESPNLELYKSLLE